MAGLQEDVSCSNNEASSQDFRLKQRHWQEREIKRLNYKHQYVLKSYVILRVAISANTSGIEIKLTVNKTAYLLRQKVAGCTQHTCKQTQEAQS